MVVIWTARARAELKKAYEYIALDSLQNAKLVRDALINITIDLSGHPEKYPLDQFKKDNDSSWRAFEKYHYRITYRVLKNEIRVVRLRHTSRSPVSF